MKPTIPHLAILAACAFFPLEAPLHAALLLEYNFNADSLTQPSSGEIGDSVTISGAGAVGADQSGVSGLAGDRAFDNTGNGAMGWGTGTPRNGVASNSTLDLPTLSELTIAGWFNASSILSGSAQLLNVGDGDLILKNDPSASGSLHLVLGGSTSTRSSGAGSYALTNTWVFFAITWDGETLKYYQGLTGTAVSQLGENISFTPAALDPDAGVWIGNGANAALNTDATRPFDGSMDNLRLYDSVLTLGQLEQLRVLDVTTVPEPSSAVLALIGLAFQGRRRRTEMRETLPA